MTTTFRDYQGAKVYFDLHLQPFICRASFFTRVSHPGPPLWSIAMVYIRFYRHINCPKIYLLHNIILVLSCLLNLFI